MSFTTCSGSQERLYTNSGMAERVVSVGSRSKIGAMASQVTRLKEYLSFLPGAGWLVAVVGAGGGQAYHRCS